VTEGGTNMGLYWDSDLRKRFMISYWHILQFVHQEGQVTANKIGEYFSLDRRELSTRINVLLASGWIKKTGRNSNTYELGNQALKFLRTYSLYSFLEEQNPRLSSAKKRAKNMQKSWADRI
jgi:predicted transcriptional regulator